MKRAQKGHSRWVDDAAVPSRIADICIITRRILCRVVRTQLVFDTLPQALDAAQLNLDSQKLLNSILNLRLQRFVHGLLLSKFLRGRCNDSGGSW